MTTPCSPVYPKSPAKGTGDYATHVVTWPFPAETLAALLPRGLELAPQTLTPSTTHPALLLFGRHSHVRPNFLPFGGMNYHEFILVIPYVQWRDASRFDYRGPFAFMPRLYLDQLFATLVGYAYGYPKLLARIQSGSTYSVHDLVLDRPLLRGDFAAYGTPVPVDSFPNFAPMRPIFEMPFVGKLDTSPYICSKMTFHLDEALARPCEARVELLYEFLPGLYPDSRVSEGIDVTPLGAFEMNVPWNLTVPFGCQCIHCQS